MFRLSLAELKSELIDLQLTKKRTPEQHKLLKVARHKVSTLERTLGIMAVMMVLSLSGCGRAVQGCMEDTADNCSWVAKKMSKHVDKADERRHKRNLDYVSRHLKVQEALKSE